MKRNKIVRESKVALFLAEDVHKAFLNAAPIDGELPLGDVYHEIINDQLVLACEEGDLNEVDNYLAIGAYVEYKNGEPLFAACKYHDLELVERLVNYHGANPRGAWLGCVDGLPVHRDLSRAFGSGSINRPEVKAINKFLKSAIESSTDKHKSAPAYGVAPENMLTEMVNEAPGDERPHEQVYNHEDYQIPKHQDNVEAVVNFSPSM